MMLSFGHVRFAGDDPGEDEFMIHAIRTRRVGPLTTNKISGGSTC